MSLSIPIQYSSVSRKIIPAQTRNDFVYQEAPTVTFTDIDALAPPLVDGESLYFTLTVERLVVAASKSIVGITNGNTASISMIDLDTRELFKGMQDEDEFVPIDAILSLWRYVGSNTSPSSRTLLISDHVSIYNNQINQCQEPAKSTFSDLTIPDAIYEGAIATLEDRINDTLRSIELKLELALAAPLLIEKYAKEAKESADLAEEWASNPHGAEVADGKFSSLSYAKDSHDSADASSASATNAAASEVLSHRWADEAEDVPVINGEYSAKHWAAKSLDAAGDKVDVIPGKGLSTNDFTDLDKESALSAELFTKKFHTSYVGFTKLTVIEKTFSSILPCALLGDGVTEKSITNSGNSLNNSETKSVFHNIDAKANKYHVEIGFPFTFEGRSITKVDVRPDGFVKLLLDSESPDYGHDLTLDFGNVNTVNYVAGVRCDLTTTTYARRIGTPGQHVLTIEYVNVKWPFDSPETPSFSRFQIKLFEATGTIEIIYDLDRVPYKSFAALSGIKGSFEFQSYAPSERKIYNTGNHYFTDNTDLGDTVGTALSVKFELPEVMDPSQLLVSLTQLEYDSLIFVNPKLLYCISG